jgi:hypothetical protein
LQAHYQTIESKADPTNLPPCPREMRPRDNVPKCFDLRRELFRASGDLAAQAVMSELGDRMDRFETEAQFVSYVDLVPNNKISGGQWWGGRRRKSAIV